MSTPTASAAPPAPPPVTEVDSSPPLVQAWEAFVGLTSRMLIMFGFYVLSIGPFYWRWYSAKFVNGSKYVAAFYEPLWALAHAIPWFGDWVDYYVQLWGTWRF